jgi:transposase
LTRWSLLKAPKNLTDKQAVTLKRLKAAGGEVWRGYMLKEAVRGIFQPGLTLNDVTVLIDRLTSRLARSRLQPFIRLGKRSASTATGSSPRSASGSTKDEPKRSTTRCA